MAADPRIFLESGHFLHDGGFVVPRRRQDLDPVPAEVERLPGNEVRRVAVQDNEPKGGQGEERKGNHLG